MPIRWMGAVGVTPDWQVLAQIEVEENCDYVDFVNLDINRDWFYILMYSIQNSYAGDTEIRIFFNGDYTSTNYYRQYLDANGGTVGAGRGNISGIGSLKNGESGEGQIFIHQDNAGYILAQGYENYGVGANVIVELKITSTANPKNNLTSIRITAVASGAIGAGSRFILARPRS